MTQSGTFSFFSHTHKRKTTPPQAEAASLFSALSRFAHDFPLAATCLVSFCIHLVVICCFQIKVWLPIEPSSLSQPPTIAIDADSILSLKSHAISLLTSSSYGEMTLDQEVASLSSMGISLATSALYGTESIPSSIKEGIENKKLQYAKHSHAEEDASQKDDMESLSSLEEGPNAPLLGRSKPAHASSLQLPQIIPWQSSSQEAPSLQLQRIYPLKITLFHGVKQLELIDDASSLFTAASEATIGLTSQFSESKPSVEFFIEVSGTSGTIASWSCVKELVDKRLQGVAIRILKTLRFRVSAVDENKSFSGMITLQFNGTFDTLAPRIIWDSAR